jgi:RNA 3'-terminal phosphate cyclase (ATP)
VKGDYLGSQEIWFEPNIIRGGEAHAEIGTAGSIPMLILAVLPICCFAEKQVTIQISKGGTDVQNSPTINYLKNILFPTLKKMGIESSLKIYKYGYYPKGQGKVKLVVNPCKNIIPIRLCEFGKIAKIKGISVCTYLEERRVAERQAKKAEELIKSLGYKSDIKVINDFSNSTQKGSSLVLWAQTNTGVILASDAIGEIRKSSENVAKEAFTKLIAEINSKVTLDTHIADMIIPYIALANGKSYYYTRLYTEHIKSNIWLVKKFLGKEIKVGNKGSVYFVSS